MTWGSFPIAIKWRIISSAAGHNAGTERYGRQLHFRGII